MLVENGKEIDLFVNRKFYYFVESKWSFRRRFNVRRFFFFLSIMLWNLCEYLWSWKVIILWVFGRDGCVFSIFGL